MPNDAKIISFKDEFAHNGRVEDQGWFEITLGIDSVAMQGLFAQAARKGYASLDSLAGDSVYIRRLGAVPAETGRWFTEYGSIRINRNVFLLNVSKGQLVLTRDKISDGW